MDLYLKIGLRVVRFLLQDCAIWKVAKLKLVRGLVWIQGTESPSLEITT